MSGEYFVYYDGSEFRVRQTDTEEVRRKSFEQLESEIDMEVNGVNGLGWAGAYSSRVSTPIYAVQEVISMFWRYERRSVERTEEIPRIFQLKAGTKYDGEDGTLEYLGNGECSLILRSRDVPFSGPLLSAPQA